MPNNPNDSRLVVISDATGSPAEAARLVQELAREGGIGTPRMQFVETIADLHQALRGLHDASIVLALHGDREGVRVGGSFLAWQLLADAVEAAGAREVYALACYSDALRDFLGDRVARSFPAEVDWEVAALDTLYQYGSHHLEGSRLTRFSQVHNDYVGAHGGADHFLDLIAAPARPLSHSYHTQDYCESQYGKWLRPAHTWTYNGPASCGTFIDPNNYACTPEQYSKAALYGFDLQTTCGRGSKTDQEQQLEAMKRDSYADVIFDSFQNAVLGHVTIKHDVVVDGVRYKVYASIFGEPAGLNSGQTIIQGAVPDACIRLASVKDLAVPGVTFTEDLAYKLRADYGWQAQQDLLTLQLCGWIGFGVPWDREEAEITAHLTFRLIIWGVEADFNFLWWSVVKLKIQFGLAFPLVLHFKPVLNPQTRNLEIPVSVSLDQPGAFLNFNGFDQFWPAPIDFTGVKAELFTLTYWCGPCFSGEASAAPGSPPPGLHADAPGATSGQADVDPDALLNFASAETGLPLEVRARSDDAQQTEPDGSTVEALVHVEELRAGDAHLNHLRSTGALDCLGVYVETLVPGRSLFLDLNDATTAGCIGQSELGRPSRFGLPQGHVIVDSPCHARLVAIAALVDSRDCNAEAPVPGYGQLLTPRLVGADPPPLNVGGGECVAGACPTEPVRRAAVDGAAQASRALDAACVAVPGLGATSPFSGHTYTGQEICAMINYQTHIAEGEDVLVDWLDDQTIRVITEVNGIFQWIVGTCSAADLSAQGLCVKLGPIAGVVQPPKTLRVSDVLDQFLRGTEGALRSYSGNGDPDSSIEAIRRQVWSENEPLRHAGGAEKDGAEGRACATVSTIPGCPHPLNYLVDEPVLFAQCAVYTIPNPLFPPPPDCIRS